MNSNEVYHLFMWLTSGFSIIQFLTIFLVMCLKVIQAGVTEKEREHCNGIDTEHVNHAGRYDFTPSSPIPLPAYPSKNSPDELYIM